MKSTKMLRGCSCKPTAARALAQPRCPRRLAHAPSRHSSTSSGSLSGSSSAWRSEGPIHAIGGVAAFVAAERLTAAALDACGIQLPASVTALCALGAAAAFPSAGVVLQRALGPGAAWLRASLPVVLAPAFLFPAICELPEREALPKLACLCAGGAIFTCGIAGHTMAVLARVAPAAAAAVDAAPCAASTARATAVLSSVQTAVAALFLGGLTSTALGAALTEPSEAVVRAPAYIGLTVALYIAAARLLPAGIRKFLPPNVGSAAALLPLLLCFPAAQQLWEGKAEPSESQHAASSGGSGVREVRTYLDGAGAILLWASQPAMVTLGLYAHTHRAVMIRERVALLTLTVVVAPATLFALAKAGAWLGLEPRHVASVLPASTSTGLALTMPSGMALIQEEWVAAGTAFNSGLVQVSLPILLGMTLLRSPLSRGVGVGCTAHVGGMAALIAAGEHAAADAAAVALVVVGVGRSVLVQVPWFSRALSEACGEVHKDATSTPCTSQADRP